MTGAAEFTTGRRGFTLSALAGLALAGSARAEEEWPQRPLRVVIPWPPGGQVDRYGRPLADALGRILGQPVVIENKGGAGGLIGAEQVSRARPDGYTLLLANNTAIVGSVATNPGNARFDTLKDFTPVGIVQESPGLFVAHPSLGVSNFEEFVAAVRKSPHPVPFASSGQGAAASMAAEAMRRRYGLEFLEVVYQGGGPRMAALLSGEVKFTMFDTNLVREHLASGAVHPLIGTGPARFEELPEVPSFGDIGLTEFDFRNWQALLVPAGVPAPVLQRLREALAEAARSPAFLQVAQDGGTAIFQTGAEAEARIARGFRDIRALQSKN
ncbi:Bug family tripartite tricarboxylate transporter substrate binding protein [Pararoseomonas indoligenes]|uniref:Tripartite tricarboxylate transporter substrate binding protein n=1 Tax=Roseomonas indoligenes TaxID=2820811 RepID=A0A940N430_9PROT|nr:tripartite tricarboxylate transporter substrate binding protein [Pararoseomonas indoligenes]MBP0496410.1 tripartite tricarboxylate transporter substrate binding protein [Pararoseomonas indoligenes]